MPLSQLSGIRLRVKSRSVVYDDVSVEVLRFRR